MVIYPEKVILLKILHIKDTTYSLDVDKNRSRGAFCACLCATYYIMHIKDMRAFTGLCLLVTSHRD